MRRITDSGLAGALNLPILGEQLYHSARWLRVFTCRPVDVSPDRLTSALLRDEADVRERIASGRGLL